MDRVMTAEERQKVLQQVKPSGRWQAPPVREAPFGNPPVPWEEQIGDLDAFRQHEGQSRKILPLISVGGQPNKVKMDSICNSIKNRLTKLFPKESWTALVRPDGIHLRYNGAKRTVERRNRKRSGVPTPATQEGDDLFDVG